MEFHSFSQRANRSLAKIGPWQTGSEKPSCHRGKNPEAQSRACLWFQESDARAWKPVSLYCQSCFLTVPLPCDTWHQDRWQVFSNIKRVICKAEEPALTFTLPKLITTSPRQIDPCSTRRSLWGWGHGTVIYLQSFSDLSPSQHLELL